MVSTAECRVNVLVGWLQLAGSTQVVSPTHEWMLDTFGGNRWFEMPNRPFGMSALFVISESCPYGAHSSGRKPWLSGDWTTLLDSPRPPRDTDSNVQDISSTDGEGASPSQRLRMRLGLLGEGCTPFIRWQTWLWSNCKAALPPTLKNRQPNSGAAPRCMPYLRAWQSRHAQTDRTLLVQLGKLCTAA